MSTTCRAGHPRAKASAATANAATANTVAAKAATAILVVSAGLLAAACGSSPAPAAARSATVASVPASPLGTSVATQAATWATVVMGGSAAQHNNFWQLFVRPAGSAQWKLVTPPGTADNGGLVLAPGSGSGLITAFRPSQLLLFTPLSQTSDAGSTWSGINPLNAGLANTAAAMAAQPAGDGLIALTVDGTAEEATAGSDAWHTLATPRTLAATSAGQRCSLTALTAVTWTPTEQLLAGTCARAGTAGIFARQDGTWQAAGPALPASLAEQKVSVSRLAADGSQTVALLTAGTGHAARLVAAWTNDGSAASTGSSSNSGASNGSGAHWTLSPQLSLGGAEPASASFGPGGQVAVITTAGHGAVIASDGSSWKQLPALPAGTATLVPAASGQVDAMAVHAGTLTVWQLAPDATTWTQLQVIKVPIQYGSSD
jgi:hypothetical protein